MAIDFRIRDYAYPWALLRLHRTLERTQWLAPDELRRYQAQRLRSVLEHARRHVPHYGRVFARLRFEPASLTDPDQLAHLPILTKAEVRALGGELLADDARRFAPRWESTSGTSGAPVRFVLDRGARVLEFCHYWRHFGWAGYRLGERVAELGDHHFRARARAADALIEWQALIGRLMLHSSRVRPDRALEIVRAFERRRPRFLKGLPSALEHLAHCVEHSTSARHRFTAVFATGEVLTRSARATIERVFGCSVFDSYGHMERTVAIAQCERGGYHVNGDYGLLELDDVRTSVGGTTTARVIGTGLHNLAMPLVRYDVGDTLELAADQTCPCGRTLPLVAGVRGRSEDAITTPDGRRVSALYSIVEGDDGTRAFQFHQEAANRVRLLVVPGEAWSEACRERLLERGRRMLGEGMQFDLTLADDADIVRSSAGKVRAVLARHGGALDEPVSRAAGAGAGGVTPGGT